MRIVHPPPACASAGRPGGGSATLPCVADLGWVFSHAEDQWELLDFRGERLMVVTAEHVERFSAAAVNAKGAQLGNRWPKLDGRPWVQCILADGPLAGTWQFLDPSKYDGPPGQLEVDLEQALPGMPDGPGPDAAVRVRPLVYRQARQGCGHGNACPWPYTFVPDAGWRRPAAGPARAAAG